MPKSPEGTFLKVVFLVDKSKIMNNIGLGTSAARRGQHLLPLSDYELGTVDPLEMNLLVAKGIPSLAHLDVQHYQQLADQWSGDSTRRLHTAEIEFHKSPRDWKNDLNFFRLGMLCWYVDEVLGIRYREDQKDLNAVWYTDPSDLFLNGVMDTRQGTCGNMAALHVALGWRLGWPVSLACAGWHIICRYDDGTITHNIEATNNGKGGFHSHPDEYYCEKYGIPAWAVQCGSDLTALSPRAMLGLFVSLRARYWRDAHRRAQSRDDGSWGLDAVNDYRLAAALFPQNRLLQQVSQEALQHSITSFISVGNCYLSQQ